jgi:hypothetical protein
MDEIINTLTFAILHLYDKVVQANYASLLAALHQKLPPDHSLLVAISSLEKMPTSLARKTVLREELEACPSLLDADTVSAIHALYMCLPPGPDKPSSPPVALAPAAAPLEYAKTEAPYTQPLPLGSSFIDKLNFGMDSAETDQNFLAKAFLYTSLFDRIKDGKKHLVLGRKGAGKTAVCLKLYDYLGKQGARVSLITPRDLQKFINAMLEKVSLNSAESALLAWKYVFLIQLAEYLLEDAKSVHGSNYLSWPDPLRQVRKFIVQHEGGKASWIEKTFRIIRSIKTIGVKTPAVEASIEVQNQNQEMREQGFDDKLDELTDAIRTSLQSLSITPIFLLVDKVDEIWDPTPESKQLIIGLLRAMKEVLEQFGSVHVIVFLRSDIYESLEFHDSDKFHSMEEHVWWKEAELKELLTLRAALSTNLLYKASGQQNDKGQSAKPQKSTEISINNTWKLFFPSHVKGQDSFEYLLRYTFMRPRDLIQLCNHCRDKAHNNIHTKVEEVDIDDALPSYSQWKLEDLSDEYRIQYPFLETLFLMVFYKTKPRLDRQAIQRSFEPLKTQLTRAYGDYYFEPLDKLLQILYNVGFLGAVDKDTVRYSFRGEKVIIPYVSQFEIHPVFRWALATAYTTPASVLSDFQDARPDSIEWDLMEDYTTKGTIRSTTPSPILSQPDTEGIDRLRRVILDDYPHGELERLLASLHLSFEIMGRGSLSRKVQELISFCLRKNRYQDLVRQILIDHPERARDIL